MCFADSHANGKHATSRAPREFDPVRIPWHHGVPGATTVAARVPATPPQTHGARVSLSPSCPAGARGHPTPSIEVRLDLSLKVAKRTRPARLGSWWAAAGVGGHTDCAAAIAGLDVPPLSSIEERRRRSISSSSEHTSGASRSRCTEASSSPPCTRGRAGPASGGLRRVATALASTVHARRSQRRRLGCTRRRRTGSFIPACRRWQQQHWRVAQHPTAAGAARWRAA